MTLDDMTRPNCPFCGNVLKHHSQAAEHAVLVNKIMGQQFGARYPGLPPDKIPQIGHQFGAPMNNSFEQFAQHQTNAAMKRAGIITLFAVVVPLVLTLVIGGIVVVMMFLVR